MGLARLDDIIEALLVHGAPAERPAAVVSQGTDVAQRAVTGTLATIAAEVRAARLPAPALLIVGDVVALHSELAWFEPAAQTSLSRSA
jgi:siroheme synthase